MAAAHDGQFRSADGSTRPPTTPARFAAELVAQNRDTGVATSPVKTATPGNPTSRPSSNGSPRPAHAHGEGSAPPGRRTARQHLLIFQRNSDSAARHRRDSSQLYERTRLAAKHRAQFRTNQATSVGQPHHLGHGSATVARNASRF